MKHINKLNLIFVAVFVSLCCMSTSLIADDFEWAPEGAMWYYSSNDENRNADELIVIESHGDTIIDGQAARFLETKAIIASSSFVSGEYYFRETLDSNYVFHKDDTLFHYDPNIEDFYPLYVFNLQENDTVLVREATQKEDCGTSFGSSLRLFSLSDQFCFEKFEYHVIQKDKAKIGDDSLAIFHTQPTSSSTWSFSLPELDTVKPVIERIGSASGFFGLPDPDYDSIVFDYQKTPRKLKCYTDKNLTYIHDSLPETLDCTDLKPDTIYDADNPPTSIEEEKVDYSFSIHPNPATQQIRIESDRLNMRGIELFSLQGKKIKHFSFSNSKKKFDLHVPESVENGLHILKIKTRKGDTYWERIIIQ